VPALRVLADVNVSYTYSPTMSRNAKPSKARIPNRLWRRPRTSLAEAERPRERLVEAHRRSRWAAALAEDYAALLGEYPDVFRRLRSSWSSFGSTPGRSAEAQAAVEAEEAADEEATRPAWRAALNDLTRAPAKPAKPELRIRPKSG